MSSLNLILTLKYADCRGDSTILYDNIWTHSIDATLQQDLKWALRHNIDATLS